MIRQIVEAVSIPVMTKVQIGHFIETQVVTSSGKIKALIIPGSRYYRALGLTHSISYLL
jgi:hypothetical protein